MELSLKLAKGALSQFLRDCFVTRMLIPDDLIAANVVCVISEAAWVFTTRVDATSALGGSLSTIQISRFTNDSQSGKQNGGFINYFLESQNE